MKYVNYPDNQTRRLSFYLATEEYLALHYPDDEYFFMWQVKPTVIFGRNQLIENEVNLDYVKSNHIEYYRRKSGGGCVYSDPSNIMFSFVTPTFAKDFVFHEYLSRVVKALQSVGIDAYVSGRNDIMLKGQKISGNAFYRVANKSVVHGTMLYNTDLSVMVKAITPNNEKLISKGIESVRQRVTNLKDHFDMDIDTFKRRMKEELSDADLTLTPEDLDGIAEIEKTYLNPDFIYGKNPKYALIRKGRAEAGTLEFSIELKNNIVKKINLLGDYFLLSDLDELLNKFLNVAFTRADFERALADFDPSQIVFQLNQKQMLDLLFQSTPL